MIKKFTIEQFIEKSNVIHGNRYDYLDSYIIGGRRFIKYICKYHGLIEQRTSSHIRSGCKLCSDDRKRSTLGEFINKSNKTHNNIYDYSKSEYINNNTNVDIICQIHGLFTQTPHNHLKGQGCPNCNGGIQYSLDDFLNKARSVHGDKYDYSICNYEKSSKKIDIICKKHGMFKCIPVNHTFKGYGCPKCRNRISKNETDWLNNIGIMYEYRQYRIDKYFVDGFDPISNTIYEFNGDYWHGNPNKYNNNDINKSCKKKFGDLYNQTILKEESLKSLGYNVISIWESDWKLKNKKEL